MRRRRPSCRPQLVTEGTRAPEGEREKDRVFLIYSYRRAIRCRSRLQPEYSGVCDRGRKKEEYIPSTAKRPYIISYRGDPVRRVGIGATPTCVSLGRQPKSSLLSQRLMLAAAAAAAAAARRSSLCAASSSPACFPRTMRPQHILNRTYFSS